MFCLICRCVEASKEAWAEDAVASVASVRAMTLMDSMIRMKPVVHQRLLSVFLRIRPELTWCESLYGIRSRNDDVPTPKFLAAKHIPTIIYPRRHHRSPCRTDHSTSFSPAAMVDLRESCWNDPKSDESDGRGKMIGRIIQIRSRRCRPRLDASAGPPDIVNSPRPSISDM